ncbi:MAG TPA: RNA polymerase sigma factor [Xanthomonadales bacterium]|nr:RNA polymerase sigma factor [Xanthomonadales bacterium]
MLSDRELATRVAISGDQAAFTLLVERHQTPIRNYLRRLMVNDDSGADDLAQDTFLAAYQKISTWQNTAKLSTWLHKIAYFKFLDYIRKNKRIQVMAEVPEGDAVKTNTADEEIMARHLMSLLKETDRAVLTLAYGAGMSHAEISRVVDKPLGSVKAQIHRAKLKLNKWLDENDHSLQTETQDKKSNGQERHA